VVETDVERVDLPLSVPFTISRGTTETTGNVLVRVTDGAGRVGLGGAAPSAYYGETAETVAAVLPEYLAVVESVGVEPRRTVERRCRERVGDNPAARGAVAVALADLAGKRHGAPLYELWGLDPADAPATSFTLGMAAPDEIHTRAEEAVAAGYDVLKVKLGGDGDDRERVRAVREAAPDARIRVDANGAFTPREAVRVSETLGEAVPLRTGFSSSSMKANSTVAPWISSFSAKSAMSERRSTGSRGSMTLILRWRRDGGYADVNLSRT
jgi:L-alanine-DL-glutamate epimerase-like enolase superfamily enzyme